jgi:serine/threonine protein kinase
MHSWVSAALALCLLLNKGFPVHKLIQRSTNRMKVAVKFITKSKVHRDSRVYCRKRDCMIPKEVEILEEVSHPNIVKFLDFYQVRHTFD